MRNLKNPLCFPRPRESSEEGICTPARAGEQSWGRESGAGTELLAGAASPPGSLQWRVQTSSFCRLCCAGKWSGTPKPGPSCS